jgi:hypothetical protein
VSSPRAIGARARAHVAEAVRRAHAVVQDRLVRYANRQYSMEGALIYSPGVGVTLRHHPPAITVKLNGTMPSALTTHYGYFDLRRRVNAHSDPARFLRPGGLGSDALEILRREIEEDAVRMVSQYLRTKGIRK